jgi:hypothetical protein
MMCLPGLILDFAGKSAQFATGLSLLEDWRRNWVQSKDWVDKFAGGQSHTIPDLH